MSLHTFFIKNINNSIGWKKIYIMIIENHDQVIANHDQI